MGFAVFTFFAIFLLFVSGGLLLFYREAMLQRINAVITPGEKRGTLTEAFSADRNGAGRSGRAI